MSDKYDKMNVVELKAALKKIGEKVSGTKAQLLARLRAATKKRKHEDTDDDGQKPPKRAKSIVEPQDKTISQRGVLEVEPEGQKPRLDNWKKNQKLQLTPDGLQVSISDRYSYEWSTIRGNMKVKQGAWYFEVSIMGGGNKMRIGWVTDQYEPSKEAGIGNDENSWSIDHNSKHHCEKTSNSNSGGYGNHWNNGDVIGCLLDLDAYRMTFYKNSKQLDSTFYNLSMKDWFRPAISLSSYYDTSAVAVNFGPDFMGKPPGCCGLNPCISRSDEESIIAVFNQFAQDDLICGDNVRVLAVEFGAEGPEDPILSCIAWKMRPEEMWVFRKTEWLAMWARERGFTLDKMKNCARQWVADLKNNGVFQNFYNWIFEYLKPAGGTMISADAALSAWRITGIKDKWNWFSEWSDWLLTGKRTVGKDTWKQMPSFIEKVGTDVGKYDEMDFWPPMFDDFIAYMKKA